QQRTTQADSNRLNTGQTVDTVHEVVEVQHPDQRNGDQYIAERSQVETSVKKQQLRHGHPEQQPERPQKVGKQSPPCPAEKPMVVHKTNQSDPGPGTDQPTGEGPAQPTKRCGNRQRSKPCDDKSHATAP